MLNPYRDFGKTYVYYGKTADSGKTILAVCFASQSLSGFTKTVKPFNKTYGYNNKLNIKKIIKMGTYTQIFWQIVYSTKNRIPVLIKENREKLF